MATIKDIAKQANVSVATVSHVINKTRYVSQELIDRVEKAMESLDYQPNIVARNLRTNKVKTIGLIIPDMSNSFFPSLVRGIEEVVNDKGCGLIVCNTDDNTSREEFYIKLLIQDKVDGLIIAPTGKSYDELKQLKKMNIPCVFIDRKVDDIEVDAILSDNEGGAYNATCHLIKRGHERIALINGPLNVTTSRERLNGYKKALEDFGIKFDPQLVTSTNSSVEGALTAFDKVLSLENKPTAIFSADNVITLGVLKGVISKGFECPKDISVIGFDDFEWASIFTPAITTIAQNPVVMGSMAAKVLFNKFEEIKQECKEIRVPTELIVRKSTQVIGRGPFGEKAADPEELELTESEIEQVKAGNYTAAISFHYSGKAWARLHEQGIKDGFNRLGIRVLAVTDAHFDPELQIKQHDSLLTMEPDVLISIPTDEIKTADSYRKIVEGKTKLVLITNVPKGLKHKDYVTCVSVNERENGQIAGRILGEYLSKAGKTKVGMIKHGAPFFATRQRDSAAEQVLREEFSNIEIVTTEEFLTEKRVYEVCHNMIKTHPDIEGIYVSWEGPAIEVLNALCELNREDVIIVTADLDSEVALNMAMGGMIKGLSSQRPYEQGRAMALAAANALLGKEVPPFIGVQPYYVTPSNLIRAWQDILKEKPPTKLINALKSNPNLAFDKQLKLSE